MTTKTGRIEILDPTAEDVPEESGLAKLRRNCVER